MASVSGPVVPRHPSPLRKGQKAPRSSNHPAPVADPYHGNEPIARLCGRFVSHLFACPEVPPTPAAPATSPTPKLDHFIAYALHRTRLHPSVTFAALYLLQRLKARFPAAKGSSGHRLFISAFMIASKIICDDTYSNKSWCIVGQGMFALREINQMEREMCSYLEWQLNVEPTTLSDFEKQVRRDFAGPGPYPAIVLPSPSPSPFSHPGASTISTSIPSFGPRASPPKPAPENITSSISYSYPSAPSTPETPSSSHSTTTSPASSASPATPVESVGYDNAKIVGSASSSSIALEHEVGDAVIAVPTSQPIKSKEVRSSPAVVAPKSKTSQFAFAARTVW